MILSYQMFNALLAQSWFFFQQNEQKEEDGLPTCSLEIADETALFPTKFGSDVCSSPLTSLLLVLGIHNEWAPKKPHIEHLKNQAPNKTGFERGHAKSHWSHSLLFYLRVWPFEGLQLYLCVSNSHQCEITKITLKLSCLTSMLMYI